MIIVVYKGYNTTEKVRYRRKGGNEAKQVKCLKFSRSARPSADLYSQKQKITNQTNLRTKPS